MWICSTVYSGKISALQTTSWSPIAAQSRTLAPVCLFFLLVSFFIPRSLPSLRLCSFHLPLFPESSVSLICRIGNWTTPGKPPLGSTSTSTSTSGDGGGKTDSASPRRSLPTGGCAVTLKHKLSQADCVAGKTYGCTGNTMWTSHGCRGVFECDGNTVKCAFTGDTTHSCPCQPGAPGALSQTQQCEAAAAASAVRAGTDMNCGGLYRDGVRLRGSSVSEGCRRHRCRCTPVSKL